MKESGHLRCRIRHACIQQFPGTLCAIAKKVRRIYVDHPTGIFNTVREYSKSGSTFRIIDQLSSERAVREAISRQDKSAAEANAINKV